MIALLHGLDQPLAVGLGWALLHFLWQGAAVAMGLAVLLAAMRRRTSQARYIVCCAALTLMCLLPVATSIYCRPAPNVNQIADIPLATTIVPADSPQVASDLDATETALVRDEALTNDSAASNEAATISQAESPAAAGPTAEMMQVWEGRLRTLIPWCVTVWLGGVFIRSLRLLVIWWRVQGMRRSGVTPVSPDVLAMVARLAARLRIARPVQLLHSTLVEVPTVIGWLRPVILLPVASLAGLSAFQLEAILVHELAHIRRWDYLINLLQNIAETLLFYHPAVWWVSGRIRQERENCCDDLAAALCADRVGYAEALVRMEELRVPIGNLVLSARGGQLLPRVRRLLGASERDRLSPLWQSGAITLLVVAGMAAGFWRMTQASTDPVLESPLTEPQANSAEREVPLPIDSESLAAEGLDADKTTPAQETDLIGDQPTSPQQSDPPAGGLSAKQVISSIGKAKQALLKVQQADGSWKTGGGDDQYPVGLTSLALLALINTGMTAAEPEVARGLNWLRRQDPSYIYEISLMIQALEVARDGKNDIGRVAKLAKELEECQIQQGLNTGSWSYSKMMRVGGGDRSNAQFAVLGLYAAQEMGIPVGLETWRRARDHWLTCQNGDGGWSYSGKGVPRASTGSMTAAGIATTVITQVMLRAEETELNADGTPVCFGEPRSDKPLEDACKWLGDNFAVTNNPGDGRWLLYYLCGLERAGRFSGRRFFINGRGKKHDWYREGAEYLVATQNARSGTWQEGQTDPIVGTSFGLQFLSKGLAPVLINKLRYGDPNRADAANDWNRHPDDVRNLTQYISNRPKWPRLLTWQTVDITQTSVAELKQAPILFFSGSAAPQFTSPEIALLKEYVRDGGFIFVDNSCRDQAFDTGFRELVRQMYPPAEGELMKLAADHPVYRSEFNLLDERTGEPSAELWGLEAGGRTVLIYSPNTISCLWDKWKSFEVRGRPPEATAMIERAVRIGTNVVAYVTGRSPGKKLK